MTWVETAGGFESIITSLALIAGGAWAYLRFVHARTIQPRIVLSVAGEASPAPTGCYVRIKVGARNRGMTMVRIAHRDTAVAVYAEMPGTDIPEWDDISAFGVLTGSDMIEPDEELEEEHLLRLPEMPRVALKLVFQLQTEAAFAGLGKASVWNTEAIVLPKREESGHGAQDGNSVPQGKVGDTTTARQVRGAARKAGRQPARVTGSKKAD